MASAILETTAIQVPEKIFFNREDFSITHKITPVLIDNFYQKNLFEKIARIISSIVLIPITSIIFLFELAKNGIQNIFTTKSVTKIKEQELPQIQLPETPDITDLEEEGDTEIEDVDETKDIDEVLEEAVTTAAVEPDDEVEEVEDVVPLTEISTAEDEVEEETPSSLKSKIVTVLSSETSKTILKTLLISAAAGGMDSAIARDFSNFLNVSAISALFQLTMKGAQKILPTSLQSKTVTALSNETSQKVIGSVLFPLALGYITSRWNGDIDYFTPVFSRALSQGALFALNNKILSKLKLQKNPIAQAAKLAVQLAGLTAIGHLFPWPASLSTEQEPLINAFGCDKEHTSCDSSGLIRDIKLSGQKDAVFTQIEKACPTLTNTTALQLPSSPCDPRKIFTDHQELISSNLLGDVLSSARTGAIISLAFTALPYAVKYAIKPTATLVTSTCKRILNRI
jgi:hypothetical protein